MLQISTPHERQVLEASDIALDTISGKVPDARNLIEGVTDRFYVATASSEEIAHRPIGTQGASHVLEEINRINATAATIAIKEYDTLY